MASCAVKPKSLCAPAFHDVMTPSSPLLMMASSEDSMMPWSNCWFAREVSCARVRSMTSSSSSFAVRASSAVRSSTRASISSRARRSSVAWASIDRRAPRQAAPAAKSRRRTEAYPASLERQSGEAPRRGQANIVSLARRGQSAKRCNPFIPRSCKIHQHPDAIRAVLSLSDISRRGAAYSRAGRPSMKSEEAENRKSAQSKGHRRRWPTRLKHARASFHQRRR